MFALRVQLAPTVADRQYTLICVHQKNREFTDFSVVHFIIRIRVLECPGLPIRPEDFSVELGFKNFLLILPTRLQFRTDKTEMGRFLNINFSFTKYNLVEKTHSDTIRRK